MNLRRKRGFISYFLIITKQHTVSETDIKRIEIYKKIKAGEITYDDLPLPVFETPEEREKRENALAGTSKKAKKTRKAVEKE